METIYLTHKEYNYALMETFLPPLNEQENVAINIPKHRLTTSADLNSKICKERTVRFQRVGSTDWQPLDKIVIVIPPRV